MIGKNSFKKFKIFLEHNEKLNIVINNSKNLLNSFLAINK